MEKMHESIVRPVEYLPEYQANVVGSCTMWRVVQESVGYNSSYNYKNIINGHIFRIPEINQPAYGSNCMWVIGAPPRVLNVMCWLLVYSTIPIVSILFYNFFFKYKFRKEGRILTQEELRTLYKERVKREKQCFIAQKTGINPAILSQFKTGKYDLYPHLFEKLENYLKENQ